LGLDNARYAVVMETTASINPDRDYVLGTHGEELARLGLQHRVWRPVVLDCWQRAGLTVGKRVLDVGAGPGYATVDLAEIVGPTGEIVALERSQNFIRAIKATCRESGGEPDGAARLPQLLADNGFVIRSTRPHVFCLRPSDYMWQWPTTFIEIYLPRLIEMGRIDQEFADKVRADLANAQANPNAMMITPLVLEIVAEKL